MVRTGSPAEVPCRKSLGLVRLHLVHLRLCPENEAGNLHLLNPVQPLHLHLQLDILIRLQSTGSWEFPLSLTNTTTSP